MDPQNEDNKYDLQNLNCCLEGGVKHTVFRQLYFPLPPHKWKMDIKPFVVSTYGMVCCPVEEQLDWLDVFRLVQELDLKRSSNQLPFCVCSFQEDGVACLTSGITLFFFPSMLYSPLGLTGQQPLAYVHITTAFAVPGKCCLKTKNALVKTLALLAVAEVSVVRSVTNDKEA